MKTICAAVLNDQNQLLPYTVQSTKSQCEEQAIKRWGWKVWFELKSKGCRVVQCELLMREETNIQAKEDK